MKVLFIDGDGELDALVFEDEFPDMERVAKEFFYDAGNPDFVTLDKGYYTVTLSIKEFGEVDSAFIEWVCDKFVDYDLTKRRNFHILKGRPLPEKRRVSMKTTTKDSPAIRERLSENERLVRKAREGGY